MQILKNKDTHIVATAFKEMFIETNGYVNCDNVIYTQYDVNNSITEEVTSMPDKFLGGCYTYIDGQWECLYPERIKLAFPAATMTMRQARLALLASNRLDVVENAVKTLSREAQIDWEYSTIIERDYPLIDELKAELNMSDNDIDELFAFAKTL